ncbi:hypothetical protein K439DRAFT_1647366 [Ramaria rubella]|nr:hypothetical protein K439DRAFT_1647366 [Ramaria rubella]
MGLKASKDPTRQHGPSIVRENIMRGHGVHLTRDYVELGIHLQDPDGFKICDPTAKKLQWVPLVTLRPHYEWSGDGHDKLNPISFPIWGICDIWSVVPNNHLGVTIAYLYLLLVEGLGGIYGMPIQLTMDCGSETKMYGFATALHEAFSPELTITELLAHVFLQSIQNTTIEPGWLCLWLQWGDNIKVIWQEGVEKYDTFCGMGVLLTHSSLKSELVQWLWPKAIQVELDQLQDHFNNHHVCKDWVKKNPSRAVDVSLICRLREDLGGDSLVQFVSNEFVVHVQEVFEMLDTHLGLDIVWLIVQAMRQSMFGK